jgi:hypothetical protein
MLVFSFKSQQRPLPKGIFQKTGQALLALPRKKVSFTLSPENTKNSPSQHGEF